MQLAREEKPGDLVTHLASAWPPDEPAGASDYLGTSLAGSVLLDAIDLGVAPDSTSELAVAVAQDPAGDGLLGVPLAHRDGRWRRAQAGDGAATALVRHLAGPAAARAEFEFRRLRPAVPPLPGQETAITADQTNESVVVADSTIVKWIRRPRRSDHPAPRLLAHLTEVGFTGIPAPAGFLLWHPPAGPAVVLASVDAYLPGALDGWTWCVDALLDHVGHAGTACPAFCPAEFAGSLGRLAAGLHAALATPSSVIPDPVRALTSADIERYRGAATDVLDRALELTGGAGGEYLREVAPRLRTSVRAPLQCAPIGSGGDGGSVPAAAGTAARGSPAGPDGPVVQPIHGDLHVGQVLRWRGGLAVIDFDGNPALPIENQGEPEPATRDVAQLLRSLDHVGRVADRRTDGTHRGEIERWISGGRRSFLTAYLQHLAAAGRSYLFEPSLLEPFEVEQECRELVYAATHLPRWTYAPLAALRAMFPLSDAGRS